MAKIIGLPKLSPTMEEGTLARWVAKEGDAVDVDDLLAEVETDKATMEFRSFDRGVLLKILASEGDTLAPDAPVAIIGEEGEDISDLLEQAKGGAAPDSGEKPKSEDSASDEEDSEEESSDDEDVDAAHKDDVASKSKKGSKKRDEKGDDERESSAEKKSGKRPAAKSFNSGERAKNKGERVFASPLVRRMGRDENVDLESIEGSGPHGRIIKRDLEAFLESGKAAQQQTADSSAQAGWARRPARVEKASQMRKAIARRLTESKQTVPHFYLTIDVDAEALVVAREQMNASLPDEKVSFNDLVIKAAAVALRRFPDANASWMDGELHYHQVVDISVAVAVADGLVTPVVRDADRKGVLAISREVKELAARARDKKLSVEEMQNGTFSISNLGMYGIEEFAAVINPPEGALLAVGALREEPVVREGQLVVGKRMKLTLSCDHRVVDGAIGAQYLKVLRGMLENPTTMLLH